MERGVQPDEGDGVDGAVRGPRLGGGSADHGCRPAERARARPVFACAPGHPFSTGRAS